MVVCHYVTGIGLNGTVNKLVVVRVGSYQVETILGREEFHMPALDDEVEYKICCVASKESGKYFCILIQYLIRNTKSVLSLLYGAPDIVVAASWGNTLYKAVGIEDYTHTLKLGLFFGFFVSKPLVQVHLIQLVEALLVKDAFVP